MQVANGNVSVLELAVLNGLCRTVKPQVIVEIGTFDGRTTLNLALNSKAQVFTLDLPRHASTRLAVDREDEKYVDKELSGKRFSQPPHHRLPCCSRITQLYGDSAIFDFSPWYEMVDLVFVDGSHSYDYVVNDSATALKLLKADGGTIVWHDYGVWPDVTKALNELNERMPSLRLVHVKDTSLVVAISPYRSRKRLYQSTYAECE
jgi:hypothetical protein